MLASIKQEPVMFQALIQATLAMLMGFGAIDITPDNAALVLAFTAALLGFLTRRVVTPVSNPRSSDGIALVKSTSGGGVSNT